MPVHLRQLWVDKRREDVPMSLNTIQRLYQSGQSPWLDNLTRHMITSGALMQLVREQGLRGITANPTTFGAALTSKDYDHDIQELVEQNKTTIHIFEALLVRDVQLACDLLREVYESSDGLDGFVSLELSPHLAYNTDETMIEARRYRELVNRPNLFIKIPATEAGIPAIEQLLYEGVAVNITLLFSIQSYQAVIEAYLSALERRATDNLPLRPIASVASFFVSRIDTLVDRLLIRRIPSTESDSESLPSKLLGRAAVANAKLAYQTFTKSFTGERWDLLASKGARVQRPLWASVGTKNPAYGDLCYLGPLIGRETVVTMPDKTWAAFVDHGDVRENAVEAGLEEASQVMRDLEKVGINLNCVLWQLEHEGVQQFVDSYDAALAALEKKRKQPFGNAVEAMR